MAHHTDLIGYFLWLLFAHWIADFCLQTRWQASNKSKNNEALFNHVGVYTTVLGAATFFFPILTDQAYIFFVALNGVLHFATDYVTSRMTSPLFMAQFDRVDIVVPPPLTGPVEKRTEARVMMKNTFDLHNFFVVVGLDQLIHQITLAATLWLVVS